MKVCEMCGACGTEKCTSRRGCELQVQHDSRWEWSYDIFYRELNKREQFGKQFSSQYKKYKRAWRMAA
jgi:hypothetical protein